MAPTVTAKVRLGSSDLPSLAVTVTVTVPAATGETVTVEPETAAVATVSSEDETVKTSASPSRSWKPWATSTSSEPSARRSDLP